MVAILIFFLFPILSLADLHSREWLKDQENLNFGELIFPHFKFISSFKNEESTLTDSDNVKDSSEIESNFRAKGYDDDWAKLGKTMLNNTIESYNTEEEKSENKAKNNLAELDYLKKWNTEGKNFDKLVLHFPEEMVMNIKNIELDKDADFTLSIHAKEKTEHDLDDLQGKESIDKQIKMPPANSEDVIVFKFSKPVDSTWKDITTIKHETESEPTHDYNLNDKINEEDIPRKLNQTATENICTYLKKTKCHEMNGLIYTPESSKAIKFKINAFLVCCILSLPPDDKLKVVPEPEKGPLKRLRRSNKEFSSLTQREFLLRNKFSTQTSQSNAPLKKIVTPDDDFLDPYWNIKNSNFKGANKQSYLKQEHYEDYVEDYVVELPKPGLLGIYSDSENKQPSWTNEYENPNPSYGVNDDYSEENIGGSFGYSTIDPRRVSASKSQRRRPVKVTTEPPEEESTFDIESHTVNFQSNPNFQVLHGFKILNLGRNKSKYRNRNSKRSTTESSVENDDERGIEDQIFGKCGKTSESKGDSESRAPEISDAETGSHPWLAVVVPSRRPQNVLCYATIIHPRVAITAGDCVSDYSKRTADKDVLVVVAGLRDVKERSETQNRMATIQIHPQWRRENLAHNLALLEWWWWYLETMNIIAWKWYFVTAKVTMLWLVLYGCGYEEKHWSRPLQLGTSVQPACLSSDYDYDHDDCRFYGWGGFDQAIRQRAHWQKATVVPPQDCNANFSKKTKLPADAYCATVKARGTVTGMGGSLVCTIDGRATSVGVAVYRDKAIVLLPAQEWIQSAMEDLKIK